MDSELFQADVAKLVGVTESTVWNWEHGTEPETRFMPKIIEFLGFVPFECSEGILGRLEYIKRIKGLSYRDMEKVLGRDAEQLQSWLSGRHIPSPQTIKYLEKHIRELS